MKKHHHDPSYPTDAAKKILIPSGAKNATNDTLLSPPPGAKCGLCGMSAISAIKDAQGVSHFYCEHHAPDHEAPSAGHSGHEKPGEPGPDRHAGHSMNMFRDRFWLSLLLTIPVVIYSDFVPRVFGFAAPAFPYSDWISPLFSTVIFFYGGLVFLRSAWGGAKGPLAGDDDPDCPGDFSCLPLQCFHSVFSAR